MKKLKQQSCITKSHAVVKRYLSESDKLTAFGMVGALEAVKLDVLDTTRKPIGMRSNHEHSRTT